MDRVVVCPYCEKSMPQPEHLGLTYLCSCGAVFALFAENELGSGLAELVDGLFEETGQPLGRLMEQCQVTVYQGYETPLDTPAPPGLAEFIKKASFGPYDQSMVHLVWVTRDDSDQPPDSFGQIQN